MYGWEWGLFTVMMMYIPNIIASIFALNDKRSSEHSKKSWTFFFVIAPLVAGTFYWLGGYFTRVKERNKFSDLLEKANATAYYEPNVSRNKRVDDSTVEVASINLVSEKYVEGNSFEPLHPTQEKYRRLLEDISKAKKEINIQYFIIKDSLIWDAIKDALIIKIKEGVKVRLIIDQFGSFLTPTKAFADFIEAGGEFVEFNRFQVSGIRGDTNFRNHMKWVLIDGKIGYTGGANIGDEYAHLESKYGYWEDLHFRVQGPIVNQMSNQFRNMWYIETGEMIEVLTNSDIAGDEKARLIADYPHENETVFLNYLLRRIGTAKNKIRIVSPYLVMPSILINKFIEAAQKGVDIEIVIPGMADKPIALWVGVMQAELLTSYGIKVYRPNDIFVHSKVYTFDDEDVIIGTSNLDFRALYLHYEANIVIKSEKLNREMNRYIDNLIPHSKLVDRTVSSWGIGRRINWAFAKLISPML